jgi:hypothetical protein
MEHTQVIALCRALLASVDKPSAGLNLWNEEAEECAQQLRAALSPATAAALRVAAVEMLHTVDAKSYERGKAAGSEPWEKLCRWTLGSESDVIVALGDAPPTLAVMASEGEVEDREAVGATFTEAATALCVVLELAE